jgi:hypothetical protein
MLTLGEQLQIIRAPNPTEVSASPDPATSLGIEDLKAQHAQAELDSYRQDTGERKKYAGRFFLLSCAWILTITTILLLQGFGRLWFPFKLSEPIILATIGSTTVNVLGILYIVANYLFPKKGPTDKA